MKQIISVLVCSIFFVVFLGLFVNRLLVAEDFEGQAILEIGDAEKLKTCSQPIINILEVNGDINDAWSRYKNGNEIVVKPGKSDIGYLCLSPSYQGGLCLTEINTALEISHIEYDFLPDAKYRISCDSEGKVELQALGSEE